MLETTYIVHPDHLFGTIGSGKLAHELKQSGSAMTLCGKSVTTSVASTKELKHCASCKTVSDSLCVDLTQRDAAAMLIPPTTKEDDMPPRKRAEAQPTAEEQAIIDVEAALTELDKPRVLPAETIAALEAQANAEILKIEVRRRVSRSMRLKEAVARANERRVRGVALAETEDWHSIEGATDLFDTGVKRIRDGVTTGLKATELATQVAHIMLEGRLRITNRKGLPDLKANSAAAKALSTEMFKAAREGVDETDVDSAEAHKSIERGVQNKMVDVTVEFLRALSGTPDEEFAKTFPMIDFAEAETKESAVRAAYEAAGLPLPEYTRAERAKIDRDDRKALEARVAAGEITAEQAEGAQTPAEIVTTTADKVTRALKGVGEIPATALEAIPAADRKILREKLAADVDRLRDLVSRLV